MSQGYSQRFIARNREADGKSLGVALGRVCIKYDVPVIAVAKALGISRATAYNWFLGDCIPKPKYHLEIRKFIQHYVG